MLSRKEIKDHDTWLMERLKGIGASEAAAVVGMSPWQSKSELWEIKTGLKKAKDLSGNEFVEKGKRMEPALRNLFLAMNPEYSVEYYEFDLISQSERPWLYATLDGELLESETGRKGILEIKTSSPMGRNAWEKWNNKIPDNYLIQTYHQLLATGYDFVVLFAGLFGEDGTMTVKTYSYDRSMVENDLAWLLEEEEKFWKTVQDKSLPGVTINF